MLPYNSRVPGLTQSLGCVCGVFQVFCFPPTSQKHASWWIATSKLPLDDGAHQWTDMPSRVYSWLVLRSAATFTY